MRIARIGAVLFLLMLCGVGWVLPAADAPALESRLASPSGAQWAGADHLGRDVLTRSLRAIARTAAVAVPAWILAVGFGVIIGIGAAMSEGGIIGRAVDWGIRIVFTTPFLLVLIAMGALIGRGLGSVFLVVVLLGWAFPARHARAIARDALHSPYSRAAMAMGYPMPRIVLHVLVPTCVLPVVVASGGLLVEIMAIDMALSLFGFGPPPPTPTLGSMLTEGLRYLNVAPWILVTPLVILGIICIGVRWLSYGMSAPALSRFASRRQMS